MPIIKGKTVIAGLLIVAIIIAISYYLSGRGERNLIALLNGDKTVEILSLETKNQQRRLVCTDREVLRYITEIILKHPREITNRPSVGGIGHKCCMKFKNGGVYNGYFEVRDDSFTFSIDSQAVEESWPTHLVLLLKPVPEKVRQIFEFLNSNDKNIAGTILIVEDGKAPHKKYDASLVAK